MAPTSCRILKTGNTLGEPHRALGSVFELTQYVLTIRKAIVAEQKK